MELTELDGLSLAELFALADVIGDKYLSEEEIAERDRELAEAFALIDEVDEAEIAHPEAITVIATESNPLDRQLKALTGDGFNLIDWQGDMNADPIILKHKTGLTVKVL